MRNYFALLLFIANAAIAATNKDGWVNIYTTDSFIFYVNTDSISREEDNIKVWGFYEYFKPQYFSEDSPISSKYHTELLELKCAESKTRLITSLWHQEKWGKGKVLQKIKIDASNVEWFDIKPGTLGETEFILLCGKKPTYVSDTVKTNWEKLYSDDKTTIYVDPSSIDIKADMVNKAVMSTIMVMVDLKVSQSSENGKPMMSMSATYEYNCSQSIDRQLKRAYYTKNMGGGVIVSENEGGKWESIPPNLLNESLFRVACGKE